MLVSENRIITAVERASQSLLGVDSDWDRLIDAIGDARLVLIGEASHGTHEFYATRADITRRLIERKGFNAVVAEADWPDAWRVNRFVRGFNDDDDANAALGGFKRFPQWMWRNRDVLEFVHWLRQYNQTLTRGTPKTGFYGMDLYSLNGSIHAVLSYLSKVDPLAAERARFRYGCFEDLGEDPQTYGYAAGFGLGRSCEDEVIQQLVELQHHAADYAHRDGRVAEDEYFYAEQNARLITNAENYYRAMFAGHASSWNLRDQHMVQTLGALRNYFDQRIGNAKIVVWAHNSHLGDARATDTSRHGELNVGQLVREKWGAEAFNIGFTTHAGTVTAANDWDEPAERKRVRPSLEESYERLFHETGRPNFLLNLRERNQATDLLREERLERAIGVIYRPQTERISHYFYANLPEQFDAVIHFDETSAVEPLERMGQWDSAELEETYPTGI